MAENKSDAVWPSLPSDHPLSIFNAELQDILKDAKYYEVYGINLAEASSFLRNIILQKFLRANANDTKAAGAQLLSTLKWRKTFQPLKAREETFSRQRFGGLGYVTTLTDVPGSPNTQDVATFNIYGAVKDNSVTFGDLDGFLRWRVGLMELTLSKLNLEETRQPIPDYGKGPDPYQCIQVHDYLSVSFLRQDANAKAAAKKTIETFQAHYPETLSRKLFANVPIIMGWLYSAISLLISKETLAKFTVITYGKDVAGVLGSSVPIAYGGVAGDLASTAETLQLGD